MRKWTHLYHYDQASVRATSTLNLKTQWIFRQPIVRSMNAISWMNEYTTHCLPQRVLCIFLSWVSQSRDLYRVWWLLYRYRQLKRPRYFELYVLSTVNALMIADYGKLSSFLTHYNPLLLLPYLPHKSSKESTKFSFQDGITREVLPECWAWHLGNSVFISIRKEIFFMYIET